MGTRSRADARTRQHGLTVGMRRVLAAVGLVSVLGLIAAAWLLTASERPAADAPPPPTVDAPTSGPLAGAAPTTGSEVLPPPDSETGLDRLPQLPQRVPLVTAPLPAPGFARDALVAGFPIEIAGPTPGSDVIDSSIATDATVMQVTLTGRTDAGAGEVRRHYSALWAAQGLAPGVDAGEGPLGYADAYSSLSLTIVPGSGTGTVYLVYGVLRTE